MAPDDEPSLVEAIARRFGVDLSTLTDQRRLDELMDAFNSLPIEQRRSITDA